MTRQSHRLVLLMVAVLTAFSVGFVSAAPKAVDASTYFDTKKWPSTDPVLMFGYLGSLNTYQAKSRMLEAGDAWDGVSGATLDFTDSWTQNSGLSQSSSCTSIPSGKVVYTAGGYSSSTLGSTMKCYGTSTIVGARVAINNGAHTFYTGTGSSGSSSYDLKAVATHELGHAAGWKGSAHLSSPCGSSDPGKATMCPSMSKTNDDWLRTLESADKTPFASHY